MKKIQINLSNKWLYTFIAVGVIVLLGVGVYSLTPGTAPNPGHLINDVAPPIGCADGQVLQFVDEANGWGCVNGLFGEGIYYKDGKLGIGVEDPQAPLHVNGWIRLDDSDAIMFGGLSTYTIDKSDGLRIKSADKVTFYEGNHYRKIIDFDMDNAIFSFLNNPDFGGHPPKVGIGVVSPSESLDIDGNGIANQWKTHSDKRLKENIFVVDTALEKIEKIRGVYFDWKDKKEEGRQMGLIAQEVEKVFPELVSTADDEMETKSINYDGMIAPVIEAIKEQQREIQILRDELCKKDSSYEWCS